MVMWGAPGQVFEGGHIFRCYGPSWTQLHKVKNRFFAEYLSITSAAVKWTYVINGVTDSDVVLYTVVTAAMLKAYYVATMQRRKLTYASKLLCVEQQFYFLFHFHCIYNELPVRLLVGLTINNGNNTNSNNNSHVRLGWILRYWVRPWNRCCSRTCHFSRKEKKSASIGGQYIFAPIAVETLGPMNTSACQLFANLGRKISSTSGDDREGAFLFQTVSVLVQNYRLASHWLHGLMICTQFCISQCLNTLRNISTYGK